LKARRQAKKDLAVLKKKQREGRVEAKFLVGPFTAHMVVGVMTPLDQRVAEKIPDRCVSRCGASSPEPEHSLVKCFI
jgi:hypothetical protein